jgi:hypothetical protein
MKRHKLRLPAGGSAVNAALTRLAANPGLDNEWYVQILGAFCFKVFSEYLLLKSDYERKQADDASLLAWRARNLLELSVWCIYLSKRRENARRLYEDAGRDALELFNAIETWGKANEQPADWFESTASGKLGLSERAASEGIKTLDGSYKVHNAAKECGMESHFRLSFKLLSKFAHPTAMQLLAPPNESKAQLQRDYFFSEGCLFFTGAFSVLESLVVS